MKVYVAFRLAIGMLIIGFALVLTRFVVPASDLLGVEDALQFFLASIVFVNMWKPTVRFFTEYPLNYGRFLSVAISFWSLSFMLASVWAITWRAFGYSPEFGDTWLRFWFRYLAVCGCVSAIAAPELYDQRKTRERVGKLGVGFVCLLFTAILIVYGGRIRGRIVHNASPSPVQIYGPNEPPLESDPDREAR